MPDLTTQNGKTGAVLRKGQFAQANWLVVGSGFYGATMAERIASVLGERVMVIEKRAVVGGNSFSRADEETGIEIHLHGSHIFHTRDSRVWEYVRSFGAFNAYRHHVLASHHGRVYPLPVCLWTLNQFFGRVFTPEEARAFLDRQRQGAVGKARNLEEKAVALIGKPLYEAFVKGYTEKQWGTAATRLPPEIITRLPVRTSYDTDYFPDPYQGIPAQGYGRLFRAMLNHPLIEVVTGVAFETVRPLLPAACRIIYTGMLDELFGCRFGRLAWRSLRFEYETVRQRDYQGTAVMNYVDPEVPFTRIHEFKHYTPENTAVAGFPATVVCREYPQAHAAGKEAYYPVEDDRNLALRDRYLNEVAKTGMIVGGRLGSYRYLNMDAAIGQALTDFASRVR